MSLFSISAFAATMHNADVVRMARHGASVSEIVEKINHSESGFKLFPEDVRALREDGVPEVVINAMNARQTGRTFELVPPAVPHSAASGSSVTSNIPETQNPDGTVPPSQISAQTHRLSTPERHHQLSADVFGGYSYLNVDTTDCRRDRAPTAGSLLWPFTQTNGSRWRETSVDTTRVTTRAGSPWA